MRARRAITSRSGSGMRMGFSTLPPQCGRGGEAGQLPRPQTKSAPSGALAHPTESAASARSRASSALAGLEAGIRLVDDVDAALAADDAAVLVPLLGRFQ